jgi:beta-glucuronidase
MAKLMTAVVVFFALLLAYSLSFAGDHVEVAKENGAWLLKINGVPAFVKGVAYTPTKRGEDPNIATRRDWMITDDNGNGKIDSPYDAYLDVNKNNLQDVDEPTVGDFQLMREMGVNTIRVYHHASTATEVQAGYGGSAATLLENNHQPNKDLLRDLYTTYGIRVAMGDLLGAYTVGSGAVFSAGTNYLDATQKARMKASVRQMVFDFKDEPFLLMYVLGNENNYSFTATNAGTQQVAYAQFVEEVVQMIHAMDPHHPVALCMGDINFNLSTLAANAPSVDIYGANAYRQGAFGNIWTQVQSLYDKPILFTEYGDYQNPFPGNEFDEVRQSNIHQTSWLDIVAHKTGATKNAIGGIAFNWVDDWWQNGLPFSHNKGTSGANLEWQGIMTQGTGPTATSPYLRQSRLVYDTYKNLWITPPQLQGDFDLDCDVDGNDYLNWQRQFGNIVPFYADADGNGNGVVDAADYTVWRNNFGATCASAVILPAANAEPACLITVSPSSHTRVESAGSLPITMTRSGNGQGRVCVSLSIDPAKTTASPYPSTISDYYFTNTQLCWPDQDTGSKTRNIVFYTDDVPELDETVAVNVAISSGSCQLSTPTVTATIINDDFPSFIGDYDGNCAADGNDYLVWQRQFGSIVSPYTGADGNGNGVVDAADYVVWRSKFGSSCLKGDMDYSGVIDNDDEMVFFQAVTNPTAYQKEYGYPPSFAGDFTGDNNVTFDDITGFNAVMAKRPLVNAGEDALLRFPNGTSIGLHGSATARSGSGQPLVAQWSVKYGDPEVVFSDTNSYSPTASVNRLGRYTLRLTVRDGIYVGYDDMVLDAQFPFLIGDYNGNCAVDGADMLLWQRELGKTVPPYSHSDGNGSGLVDSGDLDMWKNTVGLTCPPMPLPLLAGDFDRNCSVDGSDFLFWQRNVGKFVERYQGADGSGNGEIDSADLDVWRAHIGAACAAATAEAGTPDNAAGVEAVAVTNAKVYSARGEKGQIEFELPQACDVRIVLYDRRGYEVVTLLNAPMASGHHAVDWDGRDSNGEKAAPGVYSGVLTKCGHPTKFKLIVVN